MARHLQFVARVFCVGAIIVIVAIVSRQVYLRRAAEADVADADEEPPGNDVDPLRDGARSSAGWAQFGSGG